MPSAARGAASDAAAPRRVLRRAAPAPGAARRAASRPGTSFRRAQRREASRVFRAPRLARADAAEPQSVAPVPVHVEPVDLLGLRAAGTPRPANRVLVRVKVPTAAAAVAAAAHAASRPGERCFISLQELVRRQRAQACSPASRSSTRRCSASRATPTSRIEEDSDNSITRDWSRSRCGSGASSRSCGSSSAKAQARDPRQPR